jgi:hypothetical protein
VGPAARDSRGDAGAGFEFVARFKVAPVRRCQTVREDGSGKDAITGGSCADVIFAQSQTTRSLGDGNVLLCGRQRQRHVDVATDFTAAEGDTTDGTIPSTRTPRLWQA